MLLRIRQSDFWGEGKDLILVSIAKNLFKFLKTFDKLKFNVTFDTKSINNLMAILCFYVSQNKEIKKAFIEGNVLKDLMNMGNLTTSGLRPNEAEYLEAFFKLLEILSFDKEFYHYNVCKDILELFYDKNTHAFKKKIPEKKFLENFDKLYEMNKAGFREAFSMLCLVKMDKNKGLVMKLKEGKQFFNVFLKNLHFFFKRYQKIFAFRINIVVS